MNDAHSKIDITVYCARQWVDNRSGRMVSAKLTDKVPFEISCFACKTILVIT